MSDFEKEYQKIINELEKEIANKKDLEFMIFINML